MQALCGSVRRRAFPCRLRRSLFPPRSCFQLFPKREALGQIAMCSHPGMEDPRRGSLRKGQRTEKRRDSSGSGRCPTGAVAGPGPAALAGQLPLLAPGSSRDEPPLPGGKGVSPQAEGRDDFAPWRR